MEVLKYPHEHLRTTTTPVDKVTPELVQQAEEMYKVMRAENGVGLAANQVGLSISLIVLEDQGKPLFLFNPKIIQYSKETEIKYEGCLSFDKKVCRVKRSTSIKIKFRNVYNKMTYRELSGLQARACQHEMDHLLGILVIDYKGKYE